MKHRQTVPQPGRDLTAPTDTALVHTRTTEAPQPRSPLSQAVSSGHLVFTAGLVGVDPATGHAPDGIKAQTRQTLRNLEAVLAASGSSLAMVMKVTIFLRDISALSSVNSIYAEFFSAPYPARTTIETRLASEQLLIEIEAVARRSAP